MPNTTTVQKANIPTWLQGTQVTESENHPEWRRNPSHSGDIGGDFFTQKQWAYASDNLIHEFTTEFRDWTPGTVYKTTWRGPLYPALDAVVGGLPFPPAINSSTSVLEAWGTKAITECAPTKPTANLATALLELYHDGLPKLIGKDLWMSTLDGIRHLPKALGHEHLNIQFGINPLVNDIADFVKTVVHLDKLIHQYIRDNGNVVRRKWSFQPEVSDQSIIIKDKVLPMGPNVRGDVYDFSLPVTGSISRRRETRVNRWFVGAFVYHLPSTFFAQVYTPFAANWQVARRLLSADLTIETLWELAPWSWAVDWFSNVGAVLSNADAWANQGLVMKYGYIMEHSSVRDTYTHIGPTNLRGSYTGRPSQLITVTETKMRRRANPFGFGLTMSGLSFTQKSILAALGLSRLR